MADILSQEETDALLSATDGDQGGGGGAEEAMTSDDGDGEEPEPLAEEMLKMMEEEGGGGDAGGGGGFDDVSSQQPTTSYDFKHPARVNKDQLRTLENLHDNFARMLSSTFSGAMRAVVDVDTAFVDQTTYAEFILSLSNPSCSYQFTLGPTNGQAIIDVAMPVVFAFVDRIFGGKGSSQGVEARQLTPIEVGVVNRILKRVVEDLEATWEPILRVEITDIELETNPEFMQIAPASEIVILLAFEVKSTHASGLVSLCYPFFTLERILPLLGQQIYGHGQKYSIPKRREKLGPLPLDVLGPTPMSLHVELGQAQLPLSQASALKVGDVMQMNSRPGDPCVVYVGGKPKYYAQPFAEEGKNCVEISGTFPRELYNKRGIS